MIKFRQKKYFPIGISIGIIGMLIFVFGLNKYREFNIVFTPTFPVSAEESSIHLSKIASEDIPSVHNYCLKETEFSTKEDEIFCLREPYIIGKRGIEIDLSSNKTFLYDEDNLVAVLPLLYQSPPNVWHQSPTGLYKIRTREKLHWSTVGLVWMPYSMQYYEDFFLHGIPYYSDGRKLTSTVSGGCLRFADEIAKKIYDFVKIGDPILVYASVDNFIAKEGMSFPLDKENSYIFERFSNPSRYFRRFSGDRNNLYSDYYNHTGVDIKLKPQTKNKNVYAVQDGVVEKIFLTNKDDYGMGNTIILKHQQEEGYIYSLYAHLDTMEENIQEGETVKKGDILGTIGSSGFGCQNYWRIGKNGCQSQDPINELLHFEIKTAPVLENPKGGKICYDKSQAGNYCYGYAPHPLLRLGYIDPVDFLLTSNSVKEKNQEN